MFRTITADKSLPFEVTNMQNKVMTNYKILTDDARESAGTGWCFVFTSLIGVAPSLDLFSPGSGRK